jgi:hypothetical protein
LYGLHQGDRFDLIASMPIEAAQEGATGGENLSFGGVYGQQMALEAQLSNWQKQATVHVIVQNGTIVEPLSTRQIAQLPGGDPTRARIRPVQEAVVAISPEEVARLTEAMTVQARLWMVPRSGQPDDPATSRTPNLYPTSPFASGGLGGLAPGAGANGYRFVETIKGEKRELTTVPRP